MVSTENAKPKNTHSGTKALLLISFAGAIAGALVSGLLLLNPVRQVPEDSHEFEAPLIAERIKVGEPAPDFALKGLDGQLYVLSEMRGKRIAVNFWATWCGPCRIEMPELQAAQDRLGGEGFVVLAVNVGEPQALVEAYAEELELRFPVLLDEDTTVTNLYEVRPLPTTIWVDADGIVRGKHFGMLTESLIDDYWQKIISSEVGQDG